AAANTLRLFGPAAKGALRPLLAGLAGEAKAPESILRAILSGGVADAPEALQPLQKALGNKVAEVRRVAAQGLGQMGPPARPAVPYLQALLQDSDGGVRLAASAALLNILAPEG